MAGPVRYEIEHESRYTYTAPARSCVMRLCLEPRGDVGQRLMRFAVSTDPSSALNVETDAFGNTRHVLNLHREHAALAISASCAVEIRPSPVLPESLGADAWTAIHAERDAFADWDFTRPSALTTPSPALAAFMRRYGIRVRDDPLESLRLLSDTLHHTFTYSPGSTSVISPDRPHPRDRPRRLPGLRPRHDRHRPVVGNPHPLHLRLPPRHRRRRRAGAVNLDPCLGSNAACPASAGSASTPPTEPSPTTATSASPSAATTRTFPQPAASSAAPAKATSTSPSASTRSLSRQERFLHDRRP